MQSPCILQHFPGGRPENGVNPSHKPVVCVPGGVYTVLLSTLPVTSPVPSDFRIHYYNIVSLQLSPPR